MKTIEIIRAVIFDLDGLMIDSERLALKVWWDFLTEYGHSLSDAEYRKMIGMDARTSAFYVQ